MKVEVEIKLTPLRLAEAFCEMNDEDQAQFFIEAARVCRTWDDETGRAMQWWSVGKHLSACACSTEEARDLIRDIVGGMEHGRGAELSAGDPERVDDWKRIGGAIADANRLNRR